MSDGGQIRDRPGTQALTAVLLAALPLAVYAAGALLLAKFDDSSFATVLCFDPDRSANPSAARIAASVAMGWGACTFVFAVPVWLGLVLLRGWNWKPGTAHVWSIGLNTAVLMFVCLVLRQTSGVHRTSFIAAWWLWTAVLAASALRHGRLMDDLRTVVSRYGQGIALAGVAVVVGVTLFYPEQFLQCFNGDGNEDFELARSLRHHFLPTWEVESSRQEGTPRFAAVIVNPALVNSYWTLALQLVVGEAELATRLPYWCYWAGIVAVVYRLQRKSGRRSIWTGLCLPLQVLLVTIWFTFYVGYYPHMADLANPGVPDALLTLFLFLAFDCLYHRDYSGWAAALVLASLVLYSGPVFFGLSAAAAWIWQPADRHRICKAAAGGFACLAAVAAMYVAWGWSQDLLFDWWETLSGEYVQDYFYVMPLPRGESAALFFGYFVIGAGGIPAWYLARALARSGWERTVATVTLAYLAIVLCSAYKNLHYLGPILAVPVLLCGFHDGPTNRRRPSRWSWIAPISISLCIALCWPPVRPVFTLNRELGAKTIFQTDSYPTACQWGRMARDLYAYGLMGWPIGSQNWAAYSLRTEEPTDWRPLLVTDRPPPAGYRLLLETDVGVRLYVGDQQTLDWMAQQRPPAGEQRYPRVFSAIAIPRR